MNNFRFSQHLLTNKSFPFIYPSREFLQSFNKLKCAQNPYMEKYADKIAKVQRMSPEALKDSSLGSSKIHLKTDIKKEPIPKKEISHFQRQKDLSQILKLEYVQDKSAEEIETIWKKYHGVKDGVYAVLPTKSFEKIHTNLKEYPVFLFALPRAQGYEFIMCQFLDQSCYFTSLINYQAFKENAPICLTVTYFTEFQEDKGIVLMRGEYDSSLKAQEAQCLTNQLQLYYGGQDEEKLNLLWKFNKKPETFKHMDLISNFESSLGK